MVNRRTGLLACFFTLCLLVPAGVAQPAGPALTLGVLPYLPAQEVHRRFQPLAEHLAQAVGRPVVVRVGQTYDRHISAIGQDKVDIAFLGPVSYVRLIDRYGHKPILASLRVGRDPHLYAVIAVRQDSPLKRLQDLKGRRIAFADPESTTGYVIPRLMLAQAGVPLEAIGRYRHLGNHRDVALAVLAGDFDAGAMKREVYAEYAARGLRALAQGPPGPDYLFVARVGLPAAVETRLRQALESLHEQPAGRRILERLHTGLTALEMPQDSDYDGVRTHLRAIEGGDRR